MNKNTNVKIELKKVHIEKALYIILRNEWKKTHRALWSITTEAVQRGLKDMGLLKS